MTSNSKRNILKTENTEKQVTSIAGEMNFKVEEPWNTETYCRPPW